MRIITDRKRLPEGVLKVIAVLGWACVIYLCWVVFRDSLERAEFAIQAINGKIPANINPFEDRYTANPWETLAHTASGIVFAVLGPLQFVGPLRRRFPRVHRISGRIFLPVAILNGIAYHNRGLIPYGGTFLVFADYMRPAIRVASLMKLPLIYVFTHDSIAVGEDGPTHHGVFDFTFLRMVPENIFKAAANGQMLGLIFFAILFGYFVDRLGRKYTFLVTVTLMGIATAGVGFIPTVETIRNPPASARHRLIVVISRICRASASRSSEIASRASASA